MVSKVLIIAHRGASAYEPENTLRSVKRALELGVDMVEIDAQASRDGQIIVIHDAKVDRTTNGKGYVRDMTLDELKRLDAGLGERIPTLEEVIRLVGGRAQLVVEIKVPGIEEKVLQIIEKNRVESKALITSFHHPVIKRVRELSPNMRTGIIIASRPVKPENLSIDANANALFAKQTYVDIQMVEESHKNKLAVYPWTVDTLDEAKSLVKMGVDGIVTNKPDLLRSAIS